MLKLDGKTQNQTHRSPQMQEDEDMRVEQPASMESERPNQAFVESAAREYWQSIGGVGSLTKPTQQEIREAALPILSHALQRREGRAGPLETAHRAVADFVQQAREQGWTNGPLSEAYDSSSHVDALIQFARDANWLAEEISLPDHPPICYTFDEQTGRPVPRQDSFIHGEYLSDLFGAKLSEHCHIYPWVSTPSRPLPDGRRLMGASACYTLDTTPDRQKPSIAIHYRGAGKLVHRNEPVAVGEGRYGIEHDLSLRTQPLECLRAANMEIVALKDSNLSKEEIKTGIDAIRERYGLLEPHFPPPPAPECVIS